MAIFPAYPLIFFKLALQLITFKESSLGQTILAYSYWLHTTMSSPFWKAYS